MPKRAQSVLEHSYREKLSTLNLIFRLDDVDKIPMPSADKTEKDRSTMKKFWINSLPILAVLFVLIVGFTMFNNLDASPSEYNDPCPDLWAICMQESNYATVTCERYGSESNWCKDAKKDAEKACYAAVNCD